MVDESPVMATLGCEMRAQSACYRLSKCCEHAGAPIPTELMTFTCALAWMAVLVMLPLIVLCWATESRSTRIQRLRRQGLTWKAIAVRHGCSASTARRWAMQ